MMKKLVILLFVAFFATIGLNGAVEAADKVKIRSH